MKNSSNYQAESLGEWLVIATLGLVAPAQERIKLEIEAHYADAVKSNLDLGLAPEEAESAALLELGDPKTAAKSFRKRHLTEKEGEQVQELLDKYHKWNAAGWRWFDLVVSWLCGIVVYLMASSTPHMTLRFCMILLACQMAGGALIRMIFFLSHQAVIEFAFARKMFMFHILNMAIYLILVAAFTCAMVNSFGPILGYTPVLIRFIRLLRFWLKLRCLQTDPPGAVKT